MKNINEIRFNRLHQSLNETWSRSEEIDLAVDKIFKSIETSIPNANHKQLDSNLELYSGNTICTLWETDIKIEYYAYNATDTNTANYIISNGFSMNGYDETTQEMIITIYLINGDVLEPISTKNITHETEHILQIILSKKNNKNYSQLNGEEYNYAETVIYDNSTNTTAKKIATLFYYSNRHEQDAFMNEYYEDLKHNRQFILDKNSETHQRYFTYQHLAEWSKFQDNEEFNAELEKYRKFGYNKKIFSIMVEKGLRRFERKMRNIEKHFQERIKQLNETKLHYTSNAIGAFRKMQIKT